MYFPGFEQSYFNPTTNRIPGAILGNHFRAALEDTQTGQPGIQPNMLEQDIPTPWLGISYRPQSKAIVQPIHYTVAEALARRKAAQKGGA